MKQLLIIAAILLATVSKANPDTVPVQRTLPPMWEMTMHSYWLYHNDIDEPPTTDDKTWCVGLPWCCQPRENCGY